MSDVEKLWELQVVLTQLADREKLMEVKPESFAAVDREWEAANEEVSKLNASLEALARERRRVDGELMDQQELLKKYQGQLMQVKNQQQYAAAWKEIDATRKHVKELEDASLKQMTEADAIQKQLDERQAGHEDLKLRHDAEHETWQHSLGDLRKESAGLRKRAAEIEATVPEPLRRDFQKIYSQRGKIAVAKVITDSCSVCRSRIRPALMQRLKRGELVHCEGCYRILYLEKPTS